MEAVEQLAPNEKRCSKCKEIKDRSEFSKSKDKKDGLRYNCKSCIGVKDREVYQKNQGLINSSFPKCPICKNYYSVLANHSTQAHGLDRDGLKALGCTNFISNDAHQVYIKTQIGCSHLTTRKGFEATISKDRIYFPQECLPLDCLFINVVVDKEKLQIAFNPLNKLLPSAKKVQSNKRSLRKCISIYDGLVASLEIIRPIISLRGRAGFTIQFYEEDAALFDSFEFWAKSARSMRNLAKISTHKYWTTPCISIADHIWPVNAEFVYLESVGTKRNKSRYLDLIPVSRTGFIVSPKNINFKQYIGLTDCLKLKRVGLRLYARARKFFTHSNIPSGDWDLKEILPSGALRFVLSEAKAMPTIKQPRPKDLDAPKEILTPEGTFEDWLTEIGYNEDGAS